MSYLYRTGNSRNNIAYTNTANSSTKYLRRTSTGRNNIAWTTIPQGSTYNILQRNGTGRNNILWSNLKIASPGDPVTTSDIPGNDYSGLGTLPAGAVGNGSTIVLNIPLSMSSSPFTKALQASKDYSGNSIRQNPRQVFFVTTQGQSGHAGTKTIDYDMEGSLDESPLNMCPNLINYAKKLTIMCTNDIWATYHISYNRIGNFRNSIIFSCSEMKINGDFSGFLGNGNHYLNPSYLIRCTFSTTW